MTEYVNTFPKLKLGTTVTEGDMLSSAAVKLDGNGDLVPCTAATDDCAGIVHNATNFAAGFHVDLNGHGYQIFIAQGAITAGADLAPSASVPGALKAAVATDKIVGKAMEDAADGEPCFGYLYPNKTTLKA